MLELGFRVGVKVTVRNKIGFNARVKGRVRIGGIGFRVRCSVSARV